MRGLYTKSKLTCGVGVNDADYVTQEVIDGKNIACQFYSRWRDMIYRCYSKNRHKSTNPTYVCCSVDQRWHSFMNFKGWMEKQDWQGRELDKDILFEGNKVYGPDTCVFVDRDTNIFLVDSRKARGVYPIGVCKFRDKYVSRVGEGGKQPTYLGIFDTPEEAHQVWYTRKRELAIELAGKQSDPRVAAALIARFP